MNQQLSLDERLAAERRVQLGEDAQPPGLAPEEVGNPQSAIEGASNADERNNNQ